MSTTRQLFIVSGIGNGSGTGAASARVFAKHGYSVALIARGTDSLNNLANEIKEAGGDAAAFSIEDYSYKSIGGAFQAIKLHWPSVTARVALFNTVYATWGSFLDLTPEQIQESVDTNIVAGFAFAREVILMFKKQELNEHGKRGTLIFTGAGFSANGSETTSAFSAGKFGLRALSQSLNKEFGKQNIHVAHSMVNGPILTDRQRARHDSEWEQNADLRLDPESIANAYVYLASQDRSAWTWELDPLATKPGEMIR